MQGNRALLDGLSASSEDPCEEINVVIRATDSGFLVSKDCTRGVRSGRRSS